MDAVEDIKNRLSIEDVINQYIELKRSGRNFKGLSPFSNEKTASFMVSPEKQIWHDFSSGKGGNMFSFVMEIEGLDFKQALELLARQAGVDLSQYQSGQSSAYGKRRERLLAALELATKFYQLHLKSNKPALEYLLTTRKFTKDTIVAFRLGYAPNQDAALITFLRKKGFKDSEIKQAGLGTSRYRGFGDMFQGRIMIPLMDSVGLVIGFTARQLEDRQNTPKYINTPQTTVYDKSRHIFGLHLAKDAIRKTKTAVIVEGNLDVIASYQAGVRQVVATAGTAITEFHLKALSRLTYDIRLAFDQDEAGLQATERAIPIASKIGVTLSMITTPAAKDPDELIKRNPKLWKQAITQPEYAIDWLIERYQQLLDTNSAQGKRQFTDRVLAVVKDVHDYVERDHYIVELAGLIGVSAEALRAKLNDIQPSTFPTRGRAKQIRPQKINALLADNLKNQHQLLTLTLMLPSLRPFLVSMTEEMFTEEPARKLLGFLQKHPQFNATIDTQKHSDLLRGLDDYVKMLVLLYEELYQELAVLELRYEAARLQTRLIERYVKTQKTNLVLSMQTASDLETTTLLEQAKKLDKLLKDNQGDLHGG